MNFDSSLTPDGAAPVAVAATTRYSPANLLDRIEAVLNLNGDAELARVLKVAPPALTQVRQCIVPVHAALLGLMADATGMSMAELRSVLGDRRREFRC